MADNPQWWLPSIPSLSVSAAPPINRWRLFTLEVIVSPGIQTDFIICLAVAEASFWDFQAEALRGLTDSTSLLLEDSLQVRSSTTPNHHAMRKPKLTKWRGHMEEHRGTRHVSEALDCPVYPSQLPTTTQWVTPADNTLRRRTAQLSPVIPHNDKKNIVFVLNH